MSGKTHLSRRTKSNKKTEKQITTTTTLYFCKGMNKRNVLLHVTVHTKLTKTPCNYIQLFVDNNEKSN